MNHHAVELFRKKLDNLTVSDYHGLDSPGLTCYLNSVLQVLFMTEDFREAVKQCCSNSSTTIDPHLCRLFADLQKNVAKTHNVVEKLGITNIYEQRDAAEYFEKILCQTSLEAAMMFKGELNHRTTCLNCEERNDSKGGFWTLPLAVKDLCGQTYSVEKGLNAFFKGEKVCGENKMYCNRCYQKREADFGCELTQHPEVLTLLLKRFSFDYKRMSYVKLHCKVDVPRMLHVKNCRYELYAIVHHFGNLTGGHYTAQIKSFENQVWYHFDDDVVKMVRPPLFGSGDTSFRSCTAYLLMFKVSRTHGKTDEEDREAVCADSDSEAEGRHDAAEGAKALVPHHQRKGESCSGEENLKRLKQPNRRAACDSARLQNDRQEGHESTRKQSDAESKALVPHHQRKGESCSGEENLKRLKQPNRRAACDSARLQNDRQEGHESTRKQSDAESKAQMWARLSPTGELRTYDGNYMLKQDHETHSNIITKTGPAASMTKNMLKLVEAEGVKNKMETGVRREGKSKRRKRADVSEITYYSVSKPFHASTLQSEPSTKEANLSRKSASSKRDKKMQLDATAGGSYKTETTHDKGQRTKKNPVNREPWR